MSDLAEPDLGRASLGVEAKNEHPCQHPFCSIKTALLSNEAREIENVSILGNFFIYRTFCWRIGHSGESTD
jgi:hypothetical protein